MITSTFTLCVLLGAAFSAAPIETVSEGSEPASKLPGAPPAPSTSLPAAGEATLEPEPVDDEPPPPVSTAQPTTVSFTSMSPKAARPPRPIRWRLDPFVDFGSMRVSDRGFRAFGNSANLWQVGGGVRMDARLGGPVFLGGGLRYGFAYASRLIYDYTDDTALFIHQPGALARLSVVMIEGVDLVAQLGGGLVIARAALYTDDYETYASQRRFAGAFDARGGVSLYLPKARLPGRGSTRVTAGFDLLFGYELRSQLAFAPKPDAGDDAIEVRGAPLGDVAVRGFVWSLGVFLRVM